MFLGWRHFCAEAESEEYDRRGGVNTDFPTKRVSRYVGDGSEDSWKPRWCDRIRSQYLYHVVNAHQTD